MSVFEYECGYKHLFSQTAKQHKHMDRIHFSIADINTTLRFCPKNKQTNKEWKRIQSKEQSFHFSIHSQHIAPRIEPDYMKFFRMKWHQLNECMLYKLYVCVHCMWFCNFKKLHLTNEMKLGNLIPFTFEIRIWQYILIDQYFADFIEFEISFTVISAYCFSLKICNYL